MTVFEGSRLFIADNLGDELWEIDPDGSDTEGVELRSLPVELTNPQGMTVLRGRLFIADNLQATSFGKLIPMGRIRKARDYAYFRQC